MLAWWYISIGGAFILLGLRSVVRGDWIWPVVFRFVIAIGFIVLGIGTLRTPSR
jgi:tetrahydromethanopterin S-methyltransferase subunit C